jgi:hypothetical protein
MNWFATQLQAQCSKELSDDNATVQGALTGKPSAVHFHHASHINWAESLHRIAGVPRHAPSWMRDRPVDQHLLLPRRRAEHKPVRRVLLPAPARPCRPEHHQADVLRVHEDAHVALQLGAALERGREDVRRRRGHERHGADRERHGRQCADRVDDRRGARERVRPRGDDRQPRVRRGLCDRREHVDERRVADGRAPGMASDGRDGACRGLNVAALRQSLVISLW